MRFYRVSEKQYKIGETIWENGVSPRHEAARYNTNFFLKQIEEKDIVSTCKFFADSANLIYSNAYWEACFEHVRKIGFPQLPVRYENMMVFLTLDDAVYFQARYRSKVDTEIYELYSKSPHHFIGDMNMFSEIKSLPRYEENNIVGYIEVMETAIRYWNGKKTSAPRLEVILYPNTEVIVERKIILSG